jgi:hypothetical protein
MALLIPTYPNDYDAAHPLADAYAWIAGLALDLSINAGRVTLNVHPNASAWQDRPAAQLGVALGQVLVPGNPAADPPVAEVRFPRLDELMQDADFSAAYQTIGAKLYAALVATHPLLAGATMAP